MALEIAADSTAGNLQKEASALLLTCKVGVAGGDSVG